MKDIWYNLIIILPPFVFILVPFSVLIILSIRDVKRRIWPNRLERLQRWVAINAFSGIMKKTITDSSEETKWLIGKIDLTNEKKLLSKIFSGLLASFMGIFVSAATMFWQFLVLDVTYSCSVNEDTKDCFEYKLWKTDAWSRDPIDCNGATVQNGTLEVVCYKIVFNFGLASGASYGGFKLAMAALNVATTLMLMVTKPKTVSKIRAFVVIVAVGLLGAIIAVQATSLRVSFLSSNLVMIIQILVVALTVAHFVFAIPWKDLIALKVRDNEQAIGLENPAANVT